VRTLVEKESHRQIRPHASCTSAFCGSGYYRRYQVLVAIMATMSDASGGLHVRQAPVSGPFMSSFAGTLVAVSAIKCSLAERAERAVHRDLG
jgi:hypothetical protein